MAPLALRLSDGGERYTVSKLRDRATKLQKVTQSSFKCNEVKYAIYYTRTAKTGSQTAFWFKHHKSGYLSPNQVIPKPSES